MTIKDKKFFGLINDYLRVFMQSQRDLSQHTIKSYRQVLNIFLKFICGRNGILLKDISIELIDSDIISEFISWVGKERGCKPVTQNHYLTVIRSFFEYVSMREPTWTKYHLETLSIPFKKTEKKLVVNHFNEKALAAILAQPETKKPNGHRDLFFMILLYDTGARNSELLQLKIGDIVTNAKSPYVYLRGKGKKVRTVPLMQETLLHFKSYMNRFHRHFEAGDYLFFVEQHEVRNPMSDDNVGRFIKKYADSARLSCLDVPDNVTPHTFRHSRALSLYRNGMPLPLISQWLGHSQLEVTLIYAYADTEMKRLAIEKATASNNPIRENTSDFVYDTDEQTLKRLYGLLD